VLGYRWEDIHPDQHPLHHPHSAANHRKCMHESDLHVHCCTTAAVQGQRFMWSGEDR
jgi:hypothetical protein